MNTTPKTHPLAILHDEAGATDVNNETPNVADRTAMSEPLGLMSTPSHSPLLINTFLKALDPRAERFTFQLFRDPKHRKNENRPHGLRLIEHCTADEAVALAREWNTPEHAYGVFVTINETDLAGRASENIIRVRAVFIDADGDLKEVISRLQGLLKPSAIIKSSFGRAQFYWWVDDTFPLDQFNRVQRALIAKLGTDAQVHDLPRVMRLPGSLHLKGEPQLVSMWLGGPTRHSLNSIIEGLELAPFIGAATNTPTARNIATLPPRPPILGSSELSAGIDLPAFDFAKARSAGKALALAGKMDGRDGWLNLWLFPLTHEAQQHLAIEQELKSLHDEVAALSAASAASRGVRGTDGWATENDVQWADAMQRSPANPRTMGSVYEAAFAIGWAPHVTSGGNTGAALDGEIMAPSAPALATFCTELRPLPPIPGGYYSETEGLLRFLERYAFVREGGTASYFGCDAEGRLVRTDETSIEAELRNVYVWTGGTSDGDGEMRKAKPLFSWWKGTTSRPQIRVAVFKPHGGVASHEFNMWQGWGIAPLPGRDKIRRLLRHIWQIICRRDRRKYRYLRRWLAWTVQNPDKAPGVAVVLQSSREGAGKSTLSEVMLKIFGVHGTIVDTSDGLLGKHNDNLEFACFVAVEEAVFAGDKKVADQLKSRITSSSTTIEPKFKSRRSAPNRLHAMITTNHAWAAPAGDGARRWFVLSIGEEKVGDTSWFGPLFADLESGGYGQFLRFLLDLNIGQWSPRELEKTSELFEQQIMSASWTKQWLLTSAEQDEFVGGPLPLIGGPVPQKLGTSYQVDKLYGSYCNWMKSSARTPDSLPHFRKEVVSVLGGKASRPSGGANGPRIRQRYFPDGPALRRKVLRSLNIPEDYREG